MADLGAIAVSGQLKDTSANQLFVRKNGMKNTSSAKIAVMREINLGGQGSLHVGVRVDSTIGFPTPPSLAMDQAAYFKMLWPVKPGTRTITVSVKQAVNASPRPRITVKANTSIGVNSDVSENAPSGSDWVTTNAITVTPTGTGVLEVILESLYTDAYSPCYWDSVTTT